MGYRATDKRYAGDNRLIAPESSHRRRGWHLDVGLSHPGAGEGPKGPAVRRLKWYMSWVQNVVRQFGLYPSWALDDCGGRTLVREDRVGRPARVPAALPSATPGSDGRQ